MGIFEAVILGIVEGLTEFLPISSTGHLTVTEKLFGESINNPDLTAFTAVIQMGAVLATLIYFRSDIVRIVGTWLRGLVDRHQRSDPNYRFGWAVVIGSIPIGIVGVLFKHDIETTLRSLWIVAIALVAWSGVMWLADRVARQRRKEQSATWRDTLAIGVVQCLALIPGVSRSGATMSAGLLRGFDRVAATRLSFFLAIPALLAAGVLEGVSQAGNISKGVGWAPTIFATVITFGVAYVAIAWLLKFVSKHNYTVFIVYRIAAGLLIISLLATGAMRAV